MGIAEIVTLIIRGISILSNNKALGGGGIGNTRTSFLLDTLAALIQGGEETWEDLKAFSTEIQALVDTNGEPTRGQWEAMIARDQVVRQRLADNLAAIEHSEPQPEQTANLGGIKLIDPPL